jgi:hypothetical protein
MVQLNSRTYLDLFFFFFFFTAPEEYPFQKTDVRLTPPQMLDITE